MDKEKRKIISASIAERLGPEMAKDYWGIVPYGLYKYQNILELTLQEIYFLAWLIMHKWDDRNPYPSINAMERSSGYTRPYLSRIAHNIKNKGYIEIEERKLLNGATATNYYVLDNILSKIEQLLKEDRLKKEAFKKSYLSTKRAAPFPTEKTRA